LGALECKGGAENDLSFRRNNSIYIRNGRGGKDVSKEVRGGVYNGNECTICQENCTLSPYGYFVRFWGGGIGGKKGCDILIK